MLSIILFEFLYFVLKGNMSMIISPFIFFKDFVNSLIVKLLVLSEFELLIYN